MSEEADILPAHNFLDRAIQSIVSSSRFPDHEHARKPQFRVSSLPFCPITFLSEVLAYREGDVEPVDYGMEFYTSVGTAVHEALQGYAAEGTPTTFLGQWRCTRTLSRKDDGSSVTTCKCSHTKEEITSYSRLKVGDCPHGKKDCKGFFTYHEVPIHFHGLSGHVDALIKRGDKIWVVDFKTTSETLFGPEKDVQEVIAKGFYPSAKYLTQIESYCALLEKAYGLDIAGYSICYINRNKTYRADSYNPKKSWRHFPYHWTEEKRKATQERLKREITAHRLAQSILSDTEGEKDEEHIDKLMAMKPCASEATYKKSMDHKWFGSEKCPFAGVCWQDEDAMRDKLRVMLQRIRESGDL